MTIWVWKTVSWISSKNRQCNRCRELGYYAAIWLVVCSWIFATNSFVRRWNENGTSSNTRWSWTWSTLAALDPATANGPSDQREKQTTRDHRKRNNYPVSFVRITNTRYVLCHLTGQLGETLTCHVRSLISHARLLTCHARLLTRHARLLTCNARLLTCNARLLTCHVRLLIFHARLSTFHRELLAFIVRSQANFIGDCIKQIS